MPKDDRTPSIRTLWAQQIERGAAMLGLMSARIEGEQFILSDGRSFAISECHSQRIEGLSQGLTKLNA